MCTREVMHRHKRLLSDLNERRGRQRNRWPFINAACVNFRHSAVHLLPTALGSSMINPWQLPRTCHSSANTLGGQRRDNNTNKKKKNALPVKSMGIHTKKAVDEAQGEEKGADDRRDDFMPDIDLKCAHVQLSRASVRILGGVEGADCHVGRRALLLLCGC